MCTGSNFKKHFEKKWSKKAALLFALFIFLQISSEAKETNLPYNFESCSVAFEGQAYPLSTRSFFAEASLLAQHFTTSSPKSSRESMLDLQVRKTHPYLYFTDTEWELYSKNGENAQTPPLISLLSPEREIDLDRANALYTALYENYLENLPIDRNAELGLPLSLQHLQELLLIKHDQSKKPTSKKERAPEDSSPLSLAEWEQRLKKEKSQTLKTLVMNALFAILRAEKASTVLKGLSDRQLKKVQNKLKAHCSIKSPSALKTQIAQLHFELIEQERTEVIDLKKKTLRELQSFGISQGMGLIPEKMNLPPPKTFRGLDVLQRRKILDSGTYKRQYLISASEQENPLIYFVIEEISASFTESDIAVGSVSEFRMTDVFLDLKSTP